MGGVKAIGLMPQRMSRQEMRGGTWHDHKTFPRRSIGPFAVNRKGSLPRPMQPVKFGQPK
jgi:hypothetical protein